MRTAAERGQRGGPDLVKRSTKIPKAALPLRGAKSNSLKNLNTTNLTAALDPLEQRRTAIRADLLGKGDYRFASGLIFGPFPPKQTVGNDRQHDGEENRNPRHRPEFIGSSINPPHHKANDEATEHDRAGHKAHHRQPSGHGTAACRIPTTGRATPVRVITDRQDWNKESMNYPERLIALGESGTLADGAVFVSA